MAVQVQVKGPNNGLDFQLLGNDAVIQRIHLDKEVVFISDVDGKPLYLVPLNQVRLMAPMNGQGLEIPRSLGDNTALKVHIAGDNEGDFEQVCNRIEYTKKYNTMMAELLNVQKEEGKDNTLVNLLIALPLENIRYIDFNHYVAPTDTKSVAPQTEEKQAPKTQKPAGGKIKPLMPKKAIK